MFEVDKNAPAPEKFQQLMEKLENINNPEKNEKFNQNYQEILLFTGKKLNFQSFLPIHPKIV